MIQARDQRLARPERGEIVLVGLVCALAGAFQFLNRREELLGPDAVVYLRHAQESQAPGFWNDPSAFGDRYWPMGYSTALGLVDRVTTLTPELVQGLQVMLVIATALLCWWMTRHLGTRVSLIVLAAVAVSPDMVWAGRTVAYEGLLAFLIVLSLWSVWRHLPEATTQRIILGVAGGGAIGLAVLVSGRAIVLVPILLWLVARWGWPALTAFVAAFILPVGAWSLRNLLVMGIPTPMSGNMRINLWIGNNPEATTGGYMAPPTPPSGYVRDTLAYFLDDPSEFLALAIRRQARLLTPMFNEFTERGESHPVLAVFAVLFLLLVAAGLLLWWAGLLWQGRKGVPAVAAPALMASTYLLFAMPFQIEPRFRVAVTPLMIMVAVPTLLAIAHRSRERIREAQ